MPKAKVAAKPPELSVPGGKNLAGAKRAKSSPTSAARGNGGILVPGRQGFQTYFTTSLGDQIVETVKKGVPYTVAAQRHRVPQSTASRWLATGEERMETMPDDELAVFAADIREAQAVFIERAIESIVQAGMDDARQWTAIMTTLERVYPEYFRQQKGSDTNINIAIGVVERKLHELHAAGEIVYDGG